MSGKPWDREVINVRERPLSSDINSGGSMLDRALREFAMRAFTRRSGVAGNTGFLGAVQSGFIGDGFFVQGGAGAQEVVVTAGLGFINDGTDLPSSIGGVVGVDDLSSYKPQTLLTNLTITGIPNPNAINPRIDIIEVRTNRRLLDPTARDIFDPGTETFIPGVVNKTLTFNQDGQFGVVTTPTLSVAGVGYVAGIPAAVPVVPPTTVGYTKIAELRIPAAGGPIVITGAVIADTRTLIFPGGVGQVGADFQVVGGAPLLTKFIGGPSLRGTYYFPGGVVHTLYVIAGGGLFTASVVATINSNLGGLDLRTMSLTGVSLLAATAVEVAELAAATPPIVIPLGQQVLKITMSKQDSIALAAADLFWKATVTLE